MHIKPHRLNSVQPFLSSESLKSSQQKRDSTNVIDVNAAGSRAVAMPKTSLEEEQQLDKSPMKRWSLLLSFDTLWLKPRAGNATENAGNATENDTAQRSMASISLASARASATGFSVRHSRPIALHEMSRAQSGGHSSAWLDQINRWDRHVPFRTPALSYSIARLEALDNYMQSSWWLWQAVVVLFMPVPMMLVGCAFNYIPLADIELGWKANYKMFLSATLMVTFSASGLQLQRHFYVGGHRANTKRDWAVRCGIIVMYSGSFLLFNALVAFPMPCGIVSPLFIAVPFGLVALTLVYRKNLSTPRRHSAHSGLEKAKSRKQTQTTPSHNRQRALNIKRYKQLIVFYQFLLTLYPIVAFGFRMIKDKTFQMVYFMGVFPPIRWFLFRISRFLCAHVEDVAPETAVFTVGYFNALFVSLCVRGSPTKMTSWLIMGVDLLQMGYALMKLLQKARGCFDPQRLQLAFGRDCSSDLILQCMQFARANKHWLMVTDRIHHTIATSASHHRRPIRWDATNKLVFSKLRDGLTTSGVSSLDASSCLSSIPPYSRSASVNANTNTLASPGDGPHAIKATRDAQLEVLRDLIEVMFSLEQIVLVEYVESFVPFFYALYLVSAFSSPNRPYFIDLNSLSDEQSLQAVVSNVLLYGLLEFLSLLLLFVVIKWRFRLNIFTLLAFVLESHMESIQGKMMFFMSYLIAFNIRHFGMDISTWKFV